MKHFFGHFFGRSGGKSHRVDLAQSPNCKTSIFSMKKYLLLFLVLLGLSCPAFAQTALPKILTDGVDAYKSGGAAKAIDVWFAGSALDTNAANKSSFAGAFASIETTSGKFLGVESAGTVDFSPSVKYYYLVFLYEKAPYFAWFEVYTTAGKDLVTSYGANSSSSAVFPASLYKPRP
jgi:hypothetical protein